MNALFHATESRLHGLWMQALDGDQSAYREVLSELGQYLRHFLRRRMVLWPQDVEDVVQEVILAVHLKRHTYLVTQPLTAWVHAIARYKFIDYLRSRRYDLSHVDIDDCADFLACTPDPMPGDASRQVEQALSSLPPKQRQAIECTRLEGLSIEETAHRTGQTVAAVKVNIHRGLKMLATRHATH